MDARDLLEQKDFVPPEIKDIRITDAAINRLLQVCLLYTSPSPRDVEESRMPSSA